MEDKEKINLFVSYAHDDANCAAFEDFKKYILEGDQLSRYINPWFDGKILLGSKWNEEIIRNLEKADIVILVISQAFINSKYIKKELKIAFDKENEGKCKVIPLFFESLTLIDEYKFLENQGYPSGPKKIKDLNETKRGNAFKEFQGKILEIITKQKGKAEKTPPSIDKPASYQDSTISGRARQPKPNDRKFFAIIIVNYEYEFMHEKNILNIKVNLNSLKKTFTSNFNIPEENITVFENYTSYEIDKRLFGLTRNHSKDDTLFVYYSGHGIPDSEDFYWATKDTVFEDNMINTGTAFEASKIKRFLEKSPAQNKILVCDCCYAEELLKGKQFINIEGYMQQKVDLSNTFYLFSSEAKMESYYPNEEPGKATYFTDAFVKAFEEELNLGNSKITIGNIYNKTAKLIKEARTDKNPIPTPIKQPNDHSLDDLVLFLNPNSKSAEELQVNRAYDNIKDAFKKQGIEFDRRLEKENLSDEELANITKENLELVEIQERHDEISSIPDEKQKRIRLARLAVEASKFRIVAAALVRQSHSDQNNLNSAVDKSERE